MEDTLRKMREDLDAQMKRKLPNYDSSYTMSGVLQATTSTFGQLQVLLDASQRVSGTVDAAPWIASFDLVPGARVQVVYNNFNGTNFWAIIAVKPPRPEQVPIQLQNGWCLYSDVTTQDLSQAFGIPRFPPGSFANPPVSGLDQNFTGYIYASMSDTGIVHVEGLIQNVLTSTPTAGLVIATLPVNMRPTRQQAFMGINNGTGYIVLVTPDGNIRYITGVGTTYTSLNNIRFRAKSAVDAGIAPFTALSPYLVSMLAPDTTSSWYSAGPTDNTPGYTLDADGVALFEGMVKASSAYTVNISFANVTSLFTYSGGTHNLCILNNGVGIVRYGPDGVSTPSGTGSYINFGTALSTGQTATLSQIILLNPNSTTTKSVVPNFSNSWAAYGGWQTPKFAKTPGGIVIPQGFLVGGTIGGSSTSTMTVMPTGWSTRVGSMIATLSNSAIARNDIGHPGEGFARGVNAVIGSAVWWTYNGMSWPAYVGGSPMPGVNGMS